ncbi:MAG: glucoamylase family protein, partial [Parasulfuritortus sp.]|nr:glucoamylase family protein [Parasulfuritortus sp.]
MRFQGRRWPLNLADEASPLRSELFSADQMELHGKALAASHILASGRAPDQLLARLAENEDTLVEISQQLAAAVAESQRITPAGEWLLDNFYLIEEQIGTAKRHLPKGYSLELPRLARGQSTGRPRVYDIALEAVAHGDGRVDAETISRFVAAYQTVTALKLGELWAIPIMLRLAIIENIRRVGVWVATAWTERDLAASWADRMIEAAERDPKNLILVIADMARSNPPMTSAFVAELARRLQGRGPALALPLTWIEQQLAESGLTIEQLVQQENQCQAGNQVSISNSIGSLRMLGAMDWRAFVEALSVVEQTLLDDPDGVYGRMDFASRDRYRHATERIARLSPLSEGEVARMAVDLACAGIGKPWSRRSHVGYYLIDKGLAELEQAARVRLPAAEALKRALGRSPVSAYLGGIALLMVMLAAPLLIEIPGLALPLWAGLAIDLLALLAVSQLAVALVNWLVTLLITPRPLPRMDFSEAIPPQSRTLVVVPTMLTGARTIEALVEALEVRFLANRDDCLHFALLTDFRDAHEESLAEDAGLLELAKAGIDALNRKYSRAAGDSFFLMHRPRRWNPQEKIWMGYERKRGKLADLNALLRGRGEGLFALVVGDTALLGEVKYVITLDTDTDLPRDAARQFAGVMAHPLNHPHYDTVRQRVTEGYGILQPRVAISLPGTNRSRYARLYGGEPGIDPYTRAISDVYQDAFGEGSFIGKGIYDVDAFEQALSGRFPENRILSHDLLEGCYARAGLLSDVQLYEDTPARYGADVSRRHRWLRGDWQLAAWLRSRVPVPGPSRQRNPLSMLAQWKLFDNLRRSLIPAALTLLLLLSWTLLPPLWALVVLGILLIPALVSALVDLFRKPREVFLRQHLAAVAGSVYRHLTQVGFELACLPYEAFFTLDAIVRTLWRMGVSHIRLLEWNPSIDTERESARRGDLASGYRTMWVAPVLAGVTTLYLALSTPALLVLAAPILLLWALSPAIAWWLSRPLAHARAVLTAEQTEFLRLLARRTWAFFDSFVSAEDHWLPPDNYQEYRAATVAHRTSPTNMGLALLANLAACDFGYITAGRLVERTENTLLTMAGLARHRGHFYNWYDTQTLQPLPPLYISTVDSGNLAGHLLTLRAGLLGLANDRIVPARLFDGLSDTFRLLAESVDSTAAAALATFRKTLGAVTDVPPETVPAVRSTLERLAQVAAELVIRVAASPNLKPDARHESEANLWAQTLARQIGEALDEVVRFSEGAASDTIPTLRELAAAGSDRARERMVAIERLAGQAGELARMEYDFLYDRQRHLLTIGYNVSERRADASFYDLLASEARLSSFVAIAQGQLPQESWFALGRLLTGTGGEPVLLSWSGSMFEYLMPLLIMPTYDHTLLDQTCKGAVARQIEYGGQRGVPWGMSESGYNTVDVHLNYQYRAFGVPGLGLKRGLAEDLVVAPYASAMALMVAPEAACLNLQRLANLGFMGRFGFFEAIDYTPARQRRGQSHAVVHAFMAHHQGMSLLALAYLLLDRPMQRRFESDRLFQAIMLLLQERIPKATALFSHTAQLTAVHATQVAADMPIRLFDSPDTPNPEVQLLSNGRYHVMVSNAGGGYSRWKDLAVTRWREDGTCDNWGSFCYIRDVESGAFWSTAHQPTLKPAQSYEAIFSEGRAEFRRRDTVDGGEFETHTDIVVSPEDDIELRRVRITNRGRQRREIEVTSYAEVVIAPPAADALHPAFSNLFVQSEILRERRAILCTRRPRSASEVPPWMLHLVAV